MLKIDDLFVFLSFDYTLYPRGGKGVEKNKLPAVSTVWRQTLVIGVGSQLKNKYVDLFSFLAQK